MEFLILADLNGTVTPETSAKIDALDRGFLYSDGLFETMRLFGYRPCWLDRHMKRLAASADFLGIPPPDPDLVLHRVEALARSNGHCEGAARLTLTRGAAPRGPRPAPLPPDTEPAPTLFLQTRPLPADLDNRREEGVAGRSLPWPLRAEGLPLQGHKTLAYLSSVLALAQAEPGEEPILETTGGALSEGATANLFWKWGEKLYTPHPDSGCLPGVAREIVLELAQTAGIAFTEGLHPIADLRRADEAFLTNAVQGIVPLVRLDGRPVGDGAPGPITRLLMERFDEAVRTATP